MYILKIDNFYFCLIESPLENKHILQNEWINTSSKVFDDMLSKIGLYHLNNEQFIITMNSFVFQSQLYNILFEFDKVFWYIILVFDNPKAPSTYEDINGLQKNVNKSDDVIKRSPYEV